MPSLSISHVCKKINHRNQLIHMSPYETLFKQLEDWRVTEAQRLGLGQKKGPFKKLAIGKNSVL